MPLTTAEKRFWANVDKDGPVQEHCPWLGPCWVWTQSLQPSGYGNCPYPRAGGCSHRAGWLVQHGPLPKGQCVLHKCDNRACVRGSHLFLGTQADNQRDRQAKGRGPTHGQNNGRAIYTDGQVRHAKRLLAVGVDRSEVATLTGIDRGTVKAISNGRRWSKVTI